MSGQRGKAFRLEAVGNALTVIAGFLGIRYMLHKYASDLKKEISARLDKSEAVFKAELSDLKTEILARLDKSEATNKAEHAELAAQLKARGNALTELRIEVGKLSGFTDQQLLEALRHLVGGKDSGS